MVQGPKVSRASNCKRKEATTEERKNMNTPCTQLLHIPAEATIDKINAKRTYHGVVGAGGGQGDETEEGREEAEAAEPPPEGLDLWCA